MPVEIVGKEKNIRRSEGVLREVGSEEGKSSPGAASESRLIIRASDLLLVTFKRLFTAGGFLGGALFR